MARIFVNNVLPKVIAFFYPRLYRFASQPNPEKRIIIRLKHSGSSSCTMENQKNVCEPKRNVEIKAFLGTDEDYQKAVEIARNLTSKDGELLIQRDVFFNTREGRLKLRYLEDGCHQLVYYARTDKTGPKLSTYQCMAVPNAEELESILTICNGTRGIVQKERLLFIFRNTRIHLDKVKCLGNYLEFEVMLKPEDTVEMGMEFAKTLMDIFKIKEENLITGAYLDLLISGESKKTKE